MLNDLCDASARYECTGYGANLVSRHCVFIYNNLIIQITIITIQMYVIGGLYVDC